MAGAPQRARMPLQPLTPARGPAPAIPLSTLGRYGLCARGSQVLGRYRSNRYGLSPAVPQAPPCSQCQSPPCKLQYLNNRAENSHRPTRRRERQMQRFKSAGQAQRFLSAQGSIYGHFRPRRHRMAASAYREACAGAFRVWQEETCARRAG